jgi:hypothetical protein
MFVDKVDVIEYAQVFKYDRKNITGIDKITKKNVFVTEKCSFFGKNFLSVMDDR